MQDSVVRIRLPFLSQFTLTLIIYKTLEAEGGRTIRHTPSQTDFGFFVCIKTKCYFLSSNMKEQKVLFGSNSEVLLI